MAFTVLQIFDNYIDAHIVKGRLQDQGIDCWLKDENLSAIIVDPILTNAISGGIKLLVSTDQLGKAQQILKQPPGNLPEQ